MSIKYIDLFAGVGGFRYGLEKCNTRTQEDSGTLGRVGDGNENGGDLHIGQQLRERFDCVYSNEWDKYANSVYRKQFGECDDRDIREVEADELPEFDMLCGGFPCQAFSVAGKRGGFNDTRGTLFFEIARIAKQKQPRLLLLENVKGLLSHDKGRTFATILNTLDEIGYDCQWQVLNSKNFGVPQNRERVLIVGHLRGTSRPEVFPIEGCSGASLKSLSKGESQGNRIYTTDGLSATIASQAGGLGAKTGLYVSPVLTPNRENKRQNGRRFKEDGEPSFTLTQQDQHGVMLSRTVRAGGRGSTDEKHRWDIVNDGVQIRRLTPIECERLQGFPSMLHWTNMTKDELIALALSLKTISVNQETGEVFVNRGPGGIDIEPRKCGTNCNGYLVANISAGGEKKQVRLHRVVWIAINGIPPKGMAVCHKNNSKIDNRINNLYLATPQQNTIDAGKDGLLNDRNSKIDFEIAQNIRMDYKTEKYTMRTLAEKYKISKSRIHQIIHMRGWTEHGANGEKISDSQRYKMMGNAVTTNVIEAIGEKLCQKQ